MSFSRVMAVFAVACVSLVYASAAMPKFYGNGGAGTVIEINENTITATPDAALANDALACIVQGITSFSNVTVIDRNVTPVTEDEEIEGGGIISLPLRCLKAPTKTASACLRSIAA